MLANKLNYGDTIGVVGVNVKINSDNCKVEVIDEFLV